MLTAARGTDAPPRERQEVSATTIVAQTQARMREKSQEAHQGTDEHRRRQRRVGGSEAALEQIRARSSLPTPVPEGDEARPKRSVPAPRRSVPRLSLPKLNMPDTSETSWVRMVLVGLLVLLVLVILIAVVSH
jgi:hypothetical protein